MKTSYKSIIFCGPQKSGKTTLANMLVEKLGWECVELDKNKNTPLAKEQETNNLQELLEQEQAIICLGDGVGTNTVVKHGKITYGDIQSFMIRQAGHSLVILLTAGPEIIVERLIDAQKDKDLDIEEYVAQLQEYEPKYKKLTTHVIDTGKCDIDLSLRKIIALL